MNSKELSKYRISLFRDAAAFRKPERIPYMSSAVTWKVFDAGHTLDEALVNYDIMEECVRHFLNRYPVDALLDIGIRNQFRVTEAFDSKAYYYYTPEVIGIEDHAHCTVDTLEEYLKDPLAYIWTKTLPEKYGENWNKKDLSVWKKTWAEYMNYTRFIFRMAAVQKEYGIPSLAPNNPMSGTIQFGIEELMANLLGIKKLSVAMRRSPEKLDNFINGWDAEHIDPVIDKVSKGKGPDNRYCFDASIVMLAHNIMSTAQFERFYWPSFKRLLDAYSQKGMSVRLFCEGSIERFADYFKDYPKGTITMHIEQDDPFSLREKLPNIAIMGGLTTDMLSNSSPEECVKYAERLCNELGSEGGFILSENKMLSYRNDAKSDNLKAVSDYISSRIN